MAGVKPLERALAVVAARRGLVATLTAAAALVGLLVVAPGLVLAVAPGLVVVAIGALFVPFVIYFVAPMLPTSLRGVLGSLSFIIGMVTLGRAICVQLPDRSYVFRAPRRADGHWQVRHDGEWHDVGEDEATWWRLAWTPFSVTVLDPAAAFEDLRIDRAAAPEPARAELEDGRDRRAAGERNAVTDGGADPVLIRFDVLLQRLKEAGGAVHTERATDVGLQKWGPGKEMGQLAYGVLVLLGCIAGMGMAALMYG